MILTQIITNNNPITTPIKDDGSEAELFAIGVNREDISLPELIKWK